MLLSHKKLIQKTTFYTKLQLRNNNNFKTTRSWGGKIFVKLCGKIFMKTKKLGWKDIHVLGVGWKYIRDLLAS